MDVSIMLASSGSAGRRAEGGAELKARYEEVLSKLRPEQRQKVQGQVDFKGMSWMSVVPRAKESFDLSAQQWRDRVHLQYGWDFQGLPEKCDASASPLIMLSSA